MALEENNDVYPVYKQKIEKILDSSTGKVKYIVVTVYGDEETGYFADSFEYLD